jgi:hypothetical protein
MAAYRTSVIGGNTAGTDPTLAITALAGDLLVVFASISDMNTVSFTDDAGGTYTRAATGTWGTLDNGVAYVRDSLVSANATITVTGDTDTNTAVEFGIVAASGMFRAGSSAIRGHGTAAGKGAATLSATLNRLPLVSTNLILGCLASSDTTVTPPTDFVERQEASQITPTTCLEIVSRDPSATDPTSLATLGTAQWTALSGDTIAILIELDARPYGTLVRVGQQRFDVLKTADYTSGVMTYTPTPGTTLVVGRLTGGGGSGGSASTANGAAGTGGGAGEYVEFEIDGLGAPLTGGAVTVGVPQTTPASAGNPTSIVIQGVTITGQGGGGGVSVAAVAGGHSNPAPVLGASGYTGHDVARSTERGNPNGWVAATTFIGGNGASGPLGAGGAGGNAGNSDGGTGTGYGSGGGGATRFTTNQLGGPGAPGLIVLEEYAEVPTVAQIADAVWDEARAGHVTAGSFGENVVADVSKWLGVAPAALLTGLIQAVPTIHSGTAAAGAAATITLSASASLLNSVYIGDWVSIVSGTGAGQTRRIVTYVGATKVAGVDTWNTNPDVTSVYVIVPNYLAQINAISNNTITANAINSNAITAAKIATDAFGAAQLAADAVTEIQNGLATSAALATAQGDITAIKAKTDQVVFTVANRVDAQVIGMQPNTLTASALAADAVAEIQSGLATATGLGTVQTDITAITAKLLLVQFLLQGNGYIDNTVHTANGTTSARLRGFSSAAACAAATDGAFDNTQGEIARWIVTTEYDGVGQIKTHKFVQQLP